MSVSGPWGPGPPSHEAAESAMVDPTSQGTVGRDVLLFDLVGTLIDEESDYEALDAAMEAARSRFGIEEPASALSGDFSLAMMEILRSEDPAGEAGNAPPAEFVPFEKAAKEIFAAVLEVRGVNASPEDAAWFWATFVQVQKKLIRPHKDAKTALTWAKRQGYKVWILTDADEYLARDVLPATGLPALWDGCVTAAEAGYAKPEPPIFRAALARAGVPPSRAIMVGDSYERDVLGARNAGIPRAILVDRHRARTVDDVPVITSLDALPAALARLAPSMN